MKKLITTIILLSTVAFANNVDANIKTAKKLLKEKLESSERISKAQKEMREKYKVDLSHEKVPSFKIIKARAEQHNQASDRARNFINKKSYKFLTENRCNSLKKSQQYEKAICKVKHQNKIDEAISDLDSILKKRKSLRAYCMKSMIRLMKNTSESVSETTKDFLLKKIRGYRNNNQICYTAFAIASAKE